MKITFSVFARTTRVITNVKSKNSSCRIVVQSAVQVDIAVGCLGLFLFFWDESETGEE